MQIPWNDSIHIETISRNPDLKAPTTVSPSPNPTLQKFQTLFYPLPAQEKLLIINLPSTYLNNINRLHQSNHYNVHVIHCLLNAVFVIKSKTNSPFSKVTFLFLSTTLFLAKFLRPLAQIFLNFKNANLSPTAIILVNNRLIQ